MRMNHIKAGAAMVVSDIYRHSPAVQNRSIFSQRFDDQQNSSRRGAGEEQFHSEGLIEIAGVDISTL